MAGQRIADLRRHVGHSASALKAAATRLQPARTTAAFILGITTSGNKQAEQVRRFSAYAPVCSQTSARAFSPRPKTLNSGWAKCSAIFGAIVRILLSVTAATRSIF